jgi:hypothetical protein
MGRLLGCSIVALLAEVRAYWEGLAFTVDRFENAIFTDRGHTHYEFSIPTEFSPTSSIDFAFLTGGAGCLSDD